jgi:rod shape determining protein RodA
MTVIERPPLGQRLKPWFSGFDIPLLLAVLWMCGWGLLCMYSAGYDHGTRFVDHGRNMALALGLMYIVSRVPPQKLMALAVPLYALGIALLVATALFGVSKKGATRWLSIGVTQIQPSELLKIATPLMLAWWFQKREGILRWPDFIAAFVAAAAALHPDRQAARPRHRHPGAGRRPVRHLLRRPAMEADRARHRAGRRGRHRPGAQ